MKRTFLKFVSLAMLAVASFGFYSCVDPELGPDGEGDGENETPDETTDPLLEAKLKTSFQTSLEIGLNAQNLLEVAYVVREEQTEMTMPAVLFAEAIQKSTVIAPTEKTVTVNDLEAEKTYWVYFAAKVDADNFYDGIIEVEATTLGYDFTQMLTLVDKEYMGYKVRITVPEEMRNEPGKYAIRYNFGSLLDVFLSRYEMGRTWAMNLMENGHGCMGWQEALRDTTVYINPWNENRLNEDGSTYIDPDNGEPVMLHYPIAPNEPYIFAAGQYRYGHLDELGYGWSYGSEEKDWGYYIPLWDQEGWMSRYGMAPSKSDLYFDEASGTIITGEEEYWEDNSFGENGTLQVLYFKTKEPDLLETDFEVDVEWVSPIDAKINFLADDNTFCYSYTICNDATYKMLVSDLLLGHEEWLQWLVCSYYGMYHLRFPTLQGNTSLNARDYNSTPLDQENLYHILVTVTGDEFGSKQKFIHETFETTAKVLDAPVIEVTAVEDNQNEYVAKFNVKAPNKDVRRAYYAADYKREFMFEANSGVQYSDLCQNPFTSEDIKAINSDAGLEIAIDATDGQILRMAVLGYNEEETPNELYSPEKAGKSCIAVADCRTKLLDMVPRVNSPLFETLEGEWTASAQLMVREYDDNYNLQEYKKKYTARIRIMNLIETPDLTQDVYDFYADYGYNKNAVDALYEDFKREAEIFNNYRLTYRNRLLCLGWFDDDPYSTGISRLEAADPFSLFMHPEYSSIDNAQIFYDFGPKWYLEVHEDGTVTLPFNQWEMPPMTFWQRSVFFMAGYNFDENHGYKSEVLSSTTGDVLMPGEFPVTVLSDDKFVIQPAMATLYDDDNAERYAHYPNAIGGWGAADAQILRPVVSQITMTRGWSEKSSSAASRRSSAQEIRNIDITGEDAVPVVVKSITPIKNIEIPEFEEKEMFILTEEMIDASVSSYLDMKYNRK